MSATSIFIISFIGAFIIIWKTYHYFISLENAVGMSTFTYYVKRFFTSLLLGALIATIIAGQFE
jgi:hypothetical protein